MPIDVQRVWLTEETHERARIELAFLHMERATGAHRGGSDRERRALRIRQLQELATAADVGHQPPDDGVAEPGMAPTALQDPNASNSCFVNGIEPARPSSAVTPTMTPRPSDPCLTLS
jgi:transcription elongation factor GreA